MIFLASGVTSQDLISQMGYIGTQQVISMQDSLFVGFVCTRVLKSAVWRTQIHLGNLVLFESSLANIIVIYLILVWMKNTCYEFNIQK